MIGLSDSLLDEIIKMNENKIEEFSTCKFFPPIFLSHGINDDIIPIKNARDKVKNK